MRPCFSLARYFSLPSDRIGSIAHVLCEFYHGAVIDPDASPVNSVLQNFNFFNDGDCLLPRPARSASGATVKLPLRRGWHHSLREKGQQTQEPFPAFPGVFMPGKSIPRKVKTRKTNDLAVDLWVAPRRPPPTSTPQIFGPDVGVSPNRYLEFADIALGVKKTAPRRKKPSSGSEQGRHAKEHGPGVVPIDSAPPAKRGFGAFRNSR